MMYDPLILTRLQGGINPKGCTTKGATISDGNRLHDTLWDEAETKRIAERRPGAKGREIPLDMRRAGAAFEVSPASTSSTQ